jgi:hypothetical protein
MIETLAAIGFLELEILSATLKTLALALDNAFLAFASYFLIFFLSSSSALASFFLRAATFLAALS